MLEWWDFYTNIFYRGGHSPVVLQRNLAQIEKARQARADSAVSALQSAIADAVLNSHRHSGAGKILQWSDLNSSTQQIDAADCEILRDEHTHQYINKLKPSTVSGTRRSGVIELRIYDENTGQLLIANTANTKFVVEDSTIYFCRPVSITGPEGLITAEIYIESAGIHIKGVLDNGEIKHEQYTLKFSFDLIRATKEEPTVGYYHEAELLREVKGYKCPFSNVKLKSMDELLKFHAGRHLNLLFSVHPLVENAINVTRIPAIEWAREKTSRYIRQPVDDEKLGMELFTPASALLGKRTWNDSDLLL